MAIFHWSFIELPLLRIKAGLPFVHVCPHSSTGADRQGSANRVIHSQYPCCAFRRKAGTEPSTTDVWRKVHIQGYCVRPDSCCFERSGAVISELGNFSFD